MLIDENMEEGKLSKRMPPRDSVGRAFEDRFGRIFYEESTGWLSYEPVKDQDTDTHVYVFPAAITKAQIEAAMKKSLVDGKDYVFDMVKDNWWEYNPDYEY